MTLYDRDFSHIAIKPQPTYYKCKSEFVCLFITLSRLNR